MKAILENDLKVVEIFLQKLFREVYTRCFLTVRAIFY
jgi:hypothetical protein